MTDLEFFKHHFALLRSQPFERVPIVDDCLVVMRRELLAHEGNRWSHMRQVAYEAAGTVKHQSRYNFMVADDPPLHVRIERDWRNEGTPGWRCDEYLDAIEVGEFEVVPPKR